ncbi:nucleotide-diphospho-sugar transferase [Immersiella caudata]|uniref:Nucleotide-diphospho-sugar transferase n=1 Tax=Immersiella caudata TaxID=314043 RepID=A0AA39XD94_9PEZI|nr:nucleotide-diphospho-sugar transferase [Immersiella caudata]
MSPTMREQAFSNAWLMVTVVFIVHLGVWLFAWSDKALYYFLMLFIWRYARFIINFYAFFLYEPAAPPADKKTLTYTPSKDVTVILPTVDPEGDDFLECILTCAQNSPACIIIVTAGNELLAKTQSAVNPIRAQFPSVEFIVACTQVASKRRQVARAIPMVKTSIIVLLDDHVFWKPTFLPSLLLPFEDPTVGIVGTNKSVRRVPGLSPWGRFWNHLGAIYLIRHNFEIRATNTIDGGVFVVSARTCGLRASIMQDPAFLHAYTHDTCLFGLVGPLNCSDDNFNTRWCVAHGWRIKIQYTPDSEIETVVGATEPIMKKFLGQCRRWARTTWRSNATSLLTDSTVWATQPYTVYSVFLTSFTNFALITDSLLIHLLRSSECFGTRGLVYLIGWIIVTKMVKVFPYYWKYPRDVWMFPGYLAFAYAHSFIKFWAMLTWWDAHWSGRNLGAIKVAGLSLGRKERRKTVTTIVNLVEVLGRIDKAIPSLCRTIEVEAEKATGTSLLLPLGTVA